MTSYILKRLMMALPLLLGITLFSFALLKSLPGDAVTNLVGERTNPEILQEMRRHIGQERSFLAQYSGYLQLLLQGNLGRSLITQREVSSEIAKKFPNTLRLAIAAMLIALPMGVVIGLLSALLRDKPAGMILDALTISSLSIPVFWGGLLLMLLFSLTLNVLPPSGTGGINFIILPALTLAIPAASTIARLTKTSVIDVLSMPWIRTAEAKGLSPFRINTLHVLKNALIPIVTIAGLDIGSYLNGAVVTETIFGWDGIGRYAMEGIMRRDYPVIIAVVMIGTMVFVLVNTITDMLYYLLDPRIRGSEKFG